jgi:hypothetical protein
MLIPPPSYNNENSSDDGSLNELKIFKKFNQEIDIDDSSLEGGNN